VLLLIKSKYSLKKRGKQKEMGVKRFRRRGQITQLGLGAILSLVILTSSLIVAPHDFTSVEEEFVIEVWANTSISLEEFSDGVSALLLLDDGSILSGEEIELYLSGELIEKVETDSTGYAYFYNPNDSPGVHEVRVVFQGNPPNN